MKRIWAFALAVILTLSCVVPASAEVVDESVNLQADETVTESTEFDVSEQEKGEFGDTAQTSAFQEMASVYDNFNIIDEVYHTLRYDDVLDIDSVVKDYAFVGISEQNIVSNVVRNGVVTDAFDSAVLTALNDGSFVATGVGEAKILLVKKSDLSLASDVQSGKVTTSIDAVELNLNVTPAPITVAFVAGQSNAEGYNSTKIPFTPLDSVVCDKSQVYSTYAPSNSKGVLITGLPQFPACTKDTAYDYVAGNLSHNNTSSLSEKELIYKLDSLSENGMGKCGFDSAFAYEWNRLTNDKVWVINSAAGGSSIGTWQKGKTTYERAMAVFKAGQKTLDAEISAGHFVLNKRLCLWLQGEKNVETEYSVYDKYFKKTIELINSELSPDCFGIIITRSAVSGQHANYKDLTLTAPRVVQPLVSYSKDYPNVYMLSVANEFWVSDDGVRDYFSKAYPSGYLTYPRRSTASISAIPDSVKQVHFDIHYLQIAHNETGLDIARNYYDLCYSDISDATFDFITQDGERVTDTYKNDSTKKFKLSLRVHPPQLGKKYTLKLDSKYLVFDNSNGVYVPQKKGDTSIKVLDENQNTVHTLKVTIPFEVETPKIKDFENTSSGVKITWDSVKGAYKYRVFYHNGSKYVSLGTVSGNSFTHTGAKCSTTYRYTLRCVSKSGSYQSDYVKDGYYHEYLGVPKITEVKNTVDGVKISFKKIKGAESYRVFYKVQGSSKWKKVADTEKTSVTHTTAVSSKKYTYIVRCIKKDTKEYESAYDKKGKSITFVAAPKITKATKKSNGIKLYYDKVDGAEKYAVFVKTSSSWKRIGTTTNTTFTDTSAKKGKTYTYTVRCIKSDLSEYTSAYYKDGFTVKY